MKVRATQLGYYDHRRRREGEVFHIFKKEDFSSKWMESLEPEEVESEEVKKVAKKKKVVKKKAEAIDSSSEVI